MGQLSPEHAWNSEAYDAGVRHTKSEDRGQSDMDSEDLAKILNTPGSSVTINGITYSNTTGQGSTSRVQPWRGPLPPKQESPEQKGVDEKDPRKH
jgi:hypothetical protein